FRILAADVTLPGRLETAPTNVRWSQSVNATGQISRIHRREDSGAEAEWSAVQADGGAARRSVDGVARRPVRRGHRGGGGRVAPDSAESAPPARRDCAAAAAAGGGRVE